MKNITEFVESFGEALHAVEFSVSALENFSDEIKASVAQKEEGSKTMVIISGSDSVRPWTYEVTSNQVIVYIFPEDLIHQ